MPELRHLRAFVAVAEARNFTRAAERLHLGQQAVSKTVRQLEDELGVELLERTTREVRLTPAGATLLDDGRRVLAAADAAFAAARQTGHGLAGTVAVGVSPALAPAERAAVAAALRDGSPDVLVSLREVRPGEVVRMLADRDVELVIARTAPSDPALDVAPLRGTPVELLVPRGHPLAGVGRPVRLAELDGERLITHNPPGTPFTDLMLAALGAAGARVTPVEARVMGVGVPVELLDGAVAIVAAGAALGPDAVRLELADPLELPLIVVWATGRPSPAVARVRAALSAAS